MLSHTQVRKPVVPTLPPKSSELNFFERNKSSSPFAWITFSGDVKPSQPPAQKK
ncbi:hypothetical protein ACFQNF_02900 [Iodobacter arcticus]|uniref:Uncharacterized protein n=1 Tax=Iodobacter arcticus TaxID=590593 RepID=A0ABW2QTW6_9NEIS